VAVLLQATDARGKTSSYTYDALNRKTGAFDSAASAQQPADTTAGTTGNQIGAWIYDNANNVTGLTHASGHLTTENTYIGGATYTSQQINFNVFGESLGSSLTIPAAEGALAGTYTVRHVYTPNAGLPEYDVYFAGGGLPADQVLHTYMNQFDLPSALGGVKSYNQTTSYDALSRVNEITIGLTASVYTSIDNQYDQNTGRLTDRTVKLTNAGTTTAVDEQAYNYDQAGNITGQTNTRNGSTSTAETQCNSYDGLDQLTAAWTANDACAAAPTAGNSNMVADNLGAGAAYWTSWTIDDLGDRSTQVQHAFTAGPATDTTTNYTYGAAGGQPHTLTSTSTTGATTAATSYGYDNAGNMNSRNAGQGNQTIGYDDAGHLTSITGSTGGNTSYEYDADGNLLLQKDPGTTTLYTGNQQFTLNTTTATVTGTRYYTLPDGSQAIRTGTAATAFNYAIADQHGTPSLYLDSTTTTPTWRQYTPYGAARGTTITTPDNHGFLNKPMDTTTELTVIGARQYDPDTGRFITDDPVLEQTDPNQLNGYGYAGNNPVVHSDPTGMWERDPDLDDQFGRPKQKNTGHSYHQSPRGTIVNTSGCYYGRGPICARSQIEATMQTWKVSSKGLDPSFIINPCPLLHCQAPLPQQSLSPTCGGGELPRCKEKYREINIETLGFCVTGSAGAYLGFAGSLCLLIDSKGIGATWTRGAQEGAVFDKASISGGLQFSDGSIPDQSGPFQTTSIGGGDGVVGNSTYSTGSTSDGRGVTTVDFGAGVGAGFQFSGGTSTTTILKYLRW